MYQRAETTVEVTNERGVHLHVASLIAKAASAFQSDITLGRDDILANAKSVMSLTLLAASKGTRLVLTAIGPDAAQAAERLASEFQRGFGAP